MEQTGIAVPSGVPLTAALEGVMAFSLKHEIESLFAMRQTLSVRSITGQPRMSWSHCPTATNH